MSSTDIAALQEQVKALQSQTAGLAEQVAGATAVTDAADSFWALLGAVLVFFMQCGFALLEAGAVRSKTTQNILLKVSYDGTHEIRRGLIAYMGAEMWLIGAGTQPGGCSRWAITTLEAPELFTCWVAGQPLLLLFSLALVWA
eukprot:scaffold278588_cov47-Prasinocladus_malaysianus.AAC.1